MTIQLSPESRLWQVPFEKRRLGSEGGDYFDLIWLSPVSVDRSCRSQKIRENDHATDMIYLKIRTVINWESCGEQ